MRVITVVQHDANYDEAVYEDGTLCRDSETVYACELAQIGRNEPFILKFRHTDQDEWPDRLSDLPVYGEDA